MDDLAKGRHPFFSNKENLMKLSTIAMLCHSINAAYCLSQGDDSQPTWDNAPDDQKKSIEYGVQLHLKILKQHQNSHMNHGCCKRKRRLDLW